MQQTPTQADLIRLVILFATPTILKPNVVCDANPLIHQYGAYFRLLECRTVAIVVHDVENRVF